MSILAYHSVDPHFSWGVTRVTPQNFSKQIQMLVAAHTEFYTVSDYLQQSRVNTSKKIAITFDDGYESVYHFAFPVLEKYGLTATVFVNPGYVGQYNTWDATFGIRFRHMNWRQLAELLDAGWEIGSHGLWHRDITRLAKMQCAEELLLSRNIIEKRLGRCSSVFSFPFGNGNNDVWRQCREVGYTAGLAMGPNSLTAAGDEVKSRTGIYLFDNLFLFTQKAFAKNRFFFTLLQRFFDMCSNLTVLTQLKKWHVQ